MQAPARPSIPRNKSATFHFSVLSFFLLLQRIRLFLTILPTRQPARLFSPCARAFSRGPLFDSGTASSTDQSSARPKDLPPALVTQFVQSLPARRCLLLPAPARCSDPCTTTVSGPLSPQIALHLFSSSPVDAPWKKTRCIISFFHPSFRPFLPCARTAPRRPPQSSSLVVCCMRHTAPSVCFTRL